MSADEIAQKLLTTNGKGDPELVQFREALQTKSDAANPLEVFTRFFPRVNGPAELFYKLSKAARATPASGSTQVAMSSACTETAAAPALSELAQAFADAAAEFMDAMGVAEKPEIDFSECENADDAVAAFSVSGAHKRTVHKKFPFRELRQKFEEAVAELSKKKAAASAEGPSSDLGKAFRSQYIGRAHEELSEHVDACWATYVKFRTLYAYPYCAVVQSSGFGKTRLLRELAVIFKRDEAVKKKGRHRLVYVNVRDVPGSTGFPPKTKALQEHFFPSKRGSDKVAEGELADKLVDLFLFVMQPDVRDDDDDEYERDVKAAEKQGKRPPEQTTHQSLMGLFSKQDEQFTMALKAADTSALKAKHSGRSPSTSATQKRRLMVFAVDEARALLPKSDADGIGWFRILRRALSTANSKIRKLTNDSLGEKLFSGDSGIFGIVVDTNSKISNFVPSAAMDPSQRRSNRKLLLFAPFVLTQTMDVLHATVEENDQRVADTDPEKTSLARYQDEVKTALGEVGVNPSKRSSWRRLRMLGRPLWLNLEEKVVENEEGLINLAAEKLLCGKPVDNLENFNEETLNGVAALLCRVGIRPYSSSPMAAGIVADFMAVLSYVSHMHDQFVSSYSSDPILTLGATRVWHTLGGTMLAQRMLPQLRKLLHQEVMDTGNVGELVARIVLLLAMDACSMIDGDSYVSGAGEFFSVWTFLTALHGNSPTVRVVDPDKVPSQVGKAAADDLSTTPVVAAAPTTRTQHSTSATSPSAASSPVTTAKQATKAQKPQKITSSMLRNADKTATQAALEAVQKHWQDWFVSFTHFVQLADVPSEACLWAMLGRRAAGIMPRGQKAVDLVIPICTRGPLPSSSSKSASFKDEDVRVSMIFVQVKNIERGDSTFPSSATVNMRPFEVFTKKKKNKESEDSVEGLAKNQVTTSHAEEELEEKEDTSPMDETNETGEMEEEEGKEETSEMELDEPEETGEVEGEEEPRSIRLTAAQQRNLENKRRREQTQKEKQQQQKEKEEQKAIQAMREKQKKEEIAKFAALAPDSVLRIYVSLRSKKVERFYLEDTIGDRTSHVLCLKGLAPLFIDVPGENVTSGSSANVSRVNVLTEGVVDELRKLLPPWWKVRTLVEEDIDCRNKKPGVEVVMEEAGGVKTKIQRGPRFGMPKDTLLRRALKPLAESVLLNDDECTERVSLANSRLGRKANRSSGNAASSNQGVPSVSGLAKGHAGGEVKTAPTSYASGSTALATNTATMGAKRAQHSEELGAKASGPPSKKSKQ